MVARTQYETSGQWTTNQNAEIFINEISQQTDAELNVIGTSFLGNNIYSLTKGKGNRVAMYVGGVHRSEPASREAALQFARDVCYNADGIYTDYLKKFKVIFIPSISVDVEDTRVNGQGLNINRDAYQLKTLEMRALMKLFTNEKPEIFIDFHERAGTLEQIEFINTNGMDDNADSTIKILNNNMIRNIRRKLEEDGYLTAPYPAYIIGPGMTVAAAGLMGALTITPETHHDHPSKNYRVTALKDTFHKIIEWHYTSESLPYVKEIEPGEKFTLLNGDNAYFVNATKKEIIVPEGYILTKPEEFEIFKNVYNIEVIDDFVPVNQYAGRLLPHLLDLDSDMKVTDAKRIESSVVPDKLSDGRLTKVIYDKWTEVFIKQL